MTQEQKDLLLKDLCARLPYGVKLHCSSNVMICIGPYTLNTIVLDRIFNNNTEYVPFDEFKPYLFPMSSMTDEQKEFIKNKFCYDWDIDDHPYSLWAHCIVIGDADELIDWFHKNHIDYRGLIEKGLAIDATGLNIY